MEEKGAERRRRRRERGRWKTERVSGGEMTRTPLNLTDGTNTVGPRDLIGTKLIRWGLKVCNVYIGDENKTTSILWGPKR
ncbi:hypothetical protein RHMOL_Rhmol11G0169200 [Rhododendron molle]|uniref:Uncharacterized protein n=2 Tax=Rhododendron molle TaxID=49168 RepID=A0ACC0LT32_RHOML|nr:hypothetical protein RHMOL_Rhmol11G0169000 [Rhododendron molle]KAI8531866.1 hypothetical protein RHMOL_Rhmol11G0169200 [Rhododendron molle]